MPRAFRFTRRSCGGWRESQLFPAGFRRTINCKRTRETTTFLSWRPLHNRPAGGLWQVPRSVGNPASDTVDKTVHPTTLFPKPGVLRGETPKCVFGDFLHKQKVTPRSVATPLPGSSAESCIRPRQPSRAPKQKTRRDCCPPWQVAVMPLCRLTADNSTGSLFRRCSGPQNGSEVR